MKSGFSGAPSLHSLSLPQAAEVLQCGSAPNSLSYMRTRRWGEGSSVPWGMLWDSYLHCCTERRVKLKSRPDPLTLLSSGYFEKTRTVRTVGPLRAQQRDTHGAGKARSPRQRTKRDRSPHTATEQPQLQLHPRPLHSHPPVEEETGLYNFKNNRVFLSQSTMSLILSSSVGQYTVVLMH